MRHGNNLPDHPMFTKSSLRAIVQDFEDQVSNGTCHVNMSIWYQPWNVLDEHGPVMCTACLGGAYLRHLMGNNPINESISPGYLIGTVRHWFSKEVQEDGDNHERMCYLLDSLQEACRGFGSVVNLDHQPYNTTPAYGYNPKDLWRKMYRKECQRRDMSTFFWLSPILEDEDLDIFLHRIRALIAHLPMAE